MKRILFVTSSLKGGESASTGLGGELVAALSRRNPGSSVTTLDLDELRLPHLDAVEFDAWRVPAEQRGEEQGRLAAISDRLIDQLLSHDTLVLGVPMYNLAIPSTLKAWIDRVVRAGRTFRYTADGPVGLVNGVDAYAVFARGGMYRGTAVDTQTGYIEAILGLIGIRDVKKVFAEGLAMGDEQHHDAIGQAREMIASLTRDATEEVRYASA